jgi:hypothetical protein
MALRPVLPTHVKKEIVYVNLHFNNHIGKNLANFMNTMFMGEKKSLLFTKDYKKHRDSFW